MRPFALAVTSRLACSTEKSILTSSLRPLRMTWSIFSVIQDSSQRPAVKQDCITSCNMFPHTRAGVVSLEDRTRLERRGLRLHWVASERAVAVKRRSGWRMRMFDFEDIVMDRVMDEVEGIMAANDPKTLMISPGRTSVNAQSSRRMTKRCSMLRSSLTTKFY